MLVKKRYSLKNLLLWTRWEFGIFIAYASAICLLYTTLEFRFLHIPWTPIALVGTAVAFLIAFQSNAAYGRIWEARKIWGGVVNTSRTFGMKVQDMVRGPEPDFDKSKIKEVHRILVYRHIAWLTALRHAMRTKRTWETNSEHRTSKEWTSKLYIPEVKFTLQQELTKYLPMAELDYVLAKGNKSTTILYLQSKHLRKLKDEGYIWEFAFLELENVLQELFTLQGKSERIKNFPYPRQFATISHYFIWLFIILLPFGIVPEFAQIAAKLDNRIPNLHEAFVLCSTWLSVPFCALVSWVFHTMERIGRVGENPFESTPNDVPISNISRAIEIDMRQQLNEDSKIIPDQFPEDLGVQM